MCSLKLDRPKSQFASTNSMLRLMLYHKELFRLPPASRWIQVVSGLAWLTVAGKDIFLTSGESVWLLGAKEVALVSALGPSPLILEVWDNSVLTRR